MSNQRFAKELAPRLLSSLFYCPIIPTEYQPQNGILDPNDRFNFDSDKDSLCFPLRQRYSSDYHDFIRVVQTTPRLQESLAYHGTPIVRYYIKDEEKVYAITEHKNYYPHFNNSNHVQLSGVFSIGFGTTSDNKPSQRIAHIFTIEPDLPLVEPLELVVLIPRNIFTK